MIFTEELFERVLREAPAARTGIAQIARRFRDTPRLIEQFNRMWNAMPASARADVRLQNAITSTHQGNYNGAISELFTNCLLQSVFGGGIVSEPKIRKGPGPTDFLTPDFLVQAPTKDLIVETFTLDRDQARREYDRNYALLLEELQGVEGNFGISIFGLPIPNQAGGFGGIRVALEAFLRTFTLPDERGDFDERIQSVSHDGAVVQFLVQGARAAGLPVVLGSIGPIYRGNPQIQMLTSRLEAKVEKYKFPFVASVVTTGLGVADVRTLIQSMLGQEVMIIPVGDVNAPVRAELDNRGFWGIQNSNLALHLGVQGVLLIQPRYPWDDGQIALSAHLIENPQLRADLSSLFPTVPNLFRDGLLHWETEPLVLTP